MKPLTFSLFSTPETINDCDQVLEPCVNLGSRIASQMYKGVDSKNSTLLTGEFDDEDSWDVDPAVDMNTDRFDLNVDVPSAQPKSIDVPDVVE